MLYLLADTFMIATRFDHPKHPNPPIGRKRRRWRPRFTGMGTSRKLW
ncbi:MAG: hypothetical protein AAFR57_15390 [Pseudomonadota bacterium]